MYNVIKVGDKEVPMMSMASVDLYFKTIFHEDPMKIQSKPDFDTGDLLDFISKMGFVMAKFAELKSRKEMLKLNEDAYAEWLRGGWKMIGPTVERLDYMNALVDVRATYEGQSVPMSDAKKKDAEPSE